MANRIEDVGTFCSAILIAEFSSCIYFAFKGKDPIQSVWVGNWNTDSYFMEGSMSNYQKVETVDDLSIQINISCFFNSFQN